MHDRFIDVELVVSEKNGLKIPNTAIVTKTFFKIPKKFFADNGESSSPGVFALPKGGKSKDANSLHPTIYSVDENFYYIDDETVKEGDLLALMEDEEVEAYMASQGMTESEEQANEPETATEEVTEEPGEEETNPETEEKSTNVTGIMGVILILALGGIGGFVYIKSNKGKKKDNAPDPDADYFDDEDDEDYLDALDEEPEEETSPEEEDDGEEE